MPFLVNPLSLQHLVFSLAVFLPKCSFNGLSQAFFVLEKLAKEATGCNGVAPTHCGQVRGSTHHTRAIQYLAYCKCHCSLKKKKILEKNQSVVLALFASTLVLWHKVILSLHTGNFIQTHQQLWVACHHGHIIKLLPGMELVRNFPHSIFLLPVIISSQ